MSLPAQAKNALDEALAEQGLRSTRQREHVFGVLLQKRDHPTADEVYTRAREEMPTISLATVYNCLETLVQCGLVRPVNVDRQPSRFCPNLEKHAHFHDEQSGRVFDIDLPAGFIERLRDVLPEGYEMDSYELSFRGRRADEERDGRHHA
jgi:Fur family peroxide stress response transcriptional regulator